ncbi:MAG TPA: ABC transporter permease [Anaerolineaceae bacterium]|nr:ABC transporter permease [Anaerolineaceae bacterium]
MLETKASLGSVSSDLPVVVLKPSRGWSALNLKDLWRYRELIYFLVWRDIKVRYKQAVLGIGWAILQPVVTMIIFTVIFGNLAGLSSDGKPYPLFSVSAIIPWTLFAGGLSRASMSLVGNSNLLTKVYFPRLVIPLSAVVAGLVDFGISFLVMLVMMFYYGYPITWNFFWLIPLTLLTITAALAVGLWLAALNVQYRDVSHMIPFLMTVWQYASPVVYSTRTIPEKWRLIYGLNPMVGVIQGFRWVILGGTPPDQLIFVSIAVVLALLVGGLYYFRRMEKTFADMV